MAAQFKVCRLVATTVQNGLEWAVLPGGLSRQESAFQQQTSAAFSRLPGMLYFSKQNSFPTKQTNQTTVMLLQPFKLSSFSPLLTEICSNQTASSAKTQTFPSSLISPGEGRVLGTCSHAVSCSSAFSHQPPHWTYHCSWISPDAEIGKPHNGYGYYPASLGLTSYWYLNIAPELLETTSPYTVPVHVKATANICGPGHYRFVFCSTLIPPFLLHPILAKPI